MIFNSRIQLVVSLFTIAIIMASGIAQIALAFPPINAPSKIKKIPSNITNQNETISTKVKFSVSIARGSDSPSNSKFYVPSNLSVSPGDTVAWTNEDTTLHTVTSGSPGGTNLGTEFDSDYLAAGKTFQHIFNKGGTFDYFCTLHPFMTGEIKVSLP